MATGNVTLPTTSPATSAGAEKAQMPSSSRGRVTPAHGTSTSTMPPATGAVYGAQSTILKDAKR